MGPHFRESLTGSRDEYLGVVGIIIDREISLVCYPFNDLLKK